MKSKPIAIILLLLSVTLFSGCTISSLSVADTDNAPVVSPSSEIGATGVTSSSFSGSYDEMADVNGDGKNTISDVTELLNVLALDNAEERFDIDGDGIVDIRDVTALLNFLSGNRENTDVFRFLKNEEGGYYTVVGIEEPAPAQLVIPSSYNGLPVKAIENYAFYGRSTIESVILPKEIESIGAYAFSGCYHIRSVSFAEGLQVIGTGAFLGCSALQSVDIPASVCSIGSSAFSFCSSLASLSCALGNEVYYVSSDCLIRKEDAVLILGCRNSVIPKKGVTALASEAFSGCAGLKEFTLPSCITSLGTGVFSGCTDLEKVTFEAKLEKLPTATFQGCTSLTSITLPDGMKTVGSFAFSHCTALRTIDLPASLVSIERYAFAFCGELRSVVLPVGITVLTEGVFQHCRSLSTLSLHEGISAMEARAFEECTSLKELRLPASFTGTISVSAFSGCNFDSITVASGNKRYKAEGNCLIDLLQRKLIKAGNHAVIPLDSGIISIADRAFYGCIGIAELTLPTSLTEIGGSGFAHCTDLKKLIYQGGKEAWSNVKCGFDWNKDSDFTVVCVGS